MLDNRDCNLYYHRSEKSCICLFFYLLIGGDSNVISVIIHVKTNLLIAYLIKK